MWPLAALLLLVADPAFAQDGDTWPPPEMTTQPPPVPDPGHGPMPVDPVPPLASAPEATSAPAGGWGLVDYTTAAVAIIGALGTAFGGGMGAYHLTCKRDQLALTKGPMDWEAVLSRLDRIEAGQAAILEAISAGPTTSPPGRSPPSELNPTPVPLDPEPPPRSGSTVVPLG